MKRTLVWVVACSLAAAIASVLITWSIATDNDPVRVDDCVESRAAFQAAAEQVEAHASDMQIFARTHTMFPAATDFPELRNSQAVGSEAAATWHQMLARLDYKMRVTAQVIDDSPDCFSASEVAEARATLG